MNSVGRGVVSPPSESLPALALDLLRKARKGVLATLISPPDGSPYASLVAVAPDRRGEPILLLSELAWHTRNLHHDPRACLLLEAQGAPEIDPLAEPRISLLGRVKPAAPQEVSEFYLAVHPEAAAYSQFSDFKFFRFVTSQAHLVAGFGRIETMSAETLFGASD